jgi:hypothetical protein
MEKYTKKTSTRILKEVLKVKPNASKLTTHDQAFVILMTEWDLELSVETKKTTICQLYRDGEVVYKWEFKDIFKEGDWDWNVIYKTVLEDTIKNKLYKRPKLTKRQLKQKEEQKKLEEQKKQEPKIEPTPKIDIKELRKRRDNLSVKIWDWKKKGKDVVALEKELDDLKQQIKNYKK